MFQKAPDSMIPDPTPERVYAICRMVAHQSMTKDELKDAMSLGNPSNSNYSEFNASLSVATNDLGALKYVDDKLQLAVDASCFVSPAAFRRFVSSKVFLVKDSSFLLFTKWYIAQNERVFTLDDWGVKASTASKEVSALRGMKENDAYGWRFWAMFLGLGYLSGTSLIPNAKIRLEDLFITEFPKSFPYNEPVQAIDFRSWLAAKMPEADLSGIWPMAVSAGLRTLHELDIIKLEARRDTDRIKLYFVDGDPINEFSHISVREEACR